VAVQEVSNDPDSAFHIAADRLLINVLVMVKQSLYRPSKALWSLGGLSSQDFHTIGT